MDQVHGDLESGAMPKDIGKALARPYHVIKITGPKPA